MDDLLLRPHAQVPASAADRRPSNSQRSRSLASGCIDVASLRYFRHIARFRNMTAAARDLGLTQPSLSSSMRRLEEDLRATLFHRHHGGVTLTAAGAELLRRSDDVFAALERVSSAVLELEREPTGAFALACDDSLSAYFLARLLPDLLHSAPKLELTIDEARTDAIVTKVAAGEVEFGIAVNPRPHPELVMVPIFRDTLELFEPAGPRAQARTREQADQRIRERPLIVVDRPGRASTLPALSSALAARKVVPERVLRCDSFELVASLTAAGLGVGVLPRRIAAPESGPTRFTLVHRELPSFIDEVVLVHRADQATTRTANFIIDSVVHCARELPD